MGRDTLCRERQSATVIEVPCRPPSHYGSRRTGTVKRSLERGGVGCRGSQPGRLESPMASLCAETHVGLGRSPAAPRRQAPEQYSKLAIAVLSLA